MIHNKFHIFAISSGTIREKKVVCTSWKICWIVAFSSDADEANMEIGVKWCENGRIKPILV